ADNAGRKQQGFEAAHRCDLSKGVDDPHPVRRTESKSNARLPQWRPSPLASLPTVRPLPWNLCCCHIPPPIERRQATTERGRTPPRCVIAQTALMESAIVRLRVTRLGVGGMPT